MVSTLWYGAARTPKETSRVAGPAHRMRIRSRRFTTDIGSYPLGDSGATTAIRSAGHRSVDRVVSAPSARN